ncbi:MAG: endonuclease/exonuclease/phosphatase family protein, partial [Nocardioidaceae bacterium]
REPLAQEFRTVGGGRHPSAAADPASTFLAVANHFKSKGCGDEGEPADGQGCYSDDRVKQAKALVGFVDDLVDKTGTADVFLLGDFNSYTHEDALHVLYEAGYTDLNSKLAHESTYVFGGMVGSLDHVLANKAATGAVTGADVWNINSVESVLTEYSRYNYFAGDLFVPDSPYRASDHDPIVVGVDRSALSRH